MTCQANIYLQCDVFTFSTKLLVPVCMYKKGAGGWKGMRDRKREEDSGRVREWEREREIEIN